MIKALLLIILPVSTWQRIAQGRRKFLTALFLSLLPVLLVSEAGVLAGLRRWGKWGDFLGRPVELGGRITFSRHQLITYGVAEIGSSLLVVLLGAMLVMALARTFVSRHKFSECFAVVAYSFSPFFLARLCDAWSDMHPWATFAIGIALMMGALYYGVPSVLDPDPPSAFGLYLGSALLLAALAALARYVTLLVLSGKIT